MAGASCPVRWFSILRWPLDSTLARVATTERQQAKAAEREGGAVHGGRLVAQTLRSRGVTHLFTLSGGHLFSIYDGCREEGIEIVDTRHEASAAWAAEGFAKATREPGVCGLTAGPGVTNGMSPMAGAQQNRSPLVVLGGRAPEMRWGSGSLQEIDHLPFVSPVTKTASTVKDTAHIPRFTAAALDGALEQPSGPTFVDYPLDVVFQEAEAEMPDPPERSAGRPADRSDEAAALLAEAERPAIMAGTGLYWARGEDELRALAEALGIPVFLNGMGRGCLPADHELYFSRARGKGLKEADVALVVGVPLDFRLAFGGSFGEQTKIVSLDVVESELKATRQPDLELVGDIPATLEALREAAAAAGGGRGRTDPWLATLRETEAEKRVAEQEELNDDRAPLHPVRVYKELREVLDRDAIVIGDGGDFVSYAGRYIDTYEPGCWMDPGPYGCLGAGPGQAIGAAKARSDRQICLLLGDGAFGFSGMEFDTMARHGLPVVGIIGNNGIWALEHHPMKFLYGYSIAAELRPATRYDQIATALGCHAELVERPDQLRPALVRALSAGKPALVNVLTDPEVVYPRKAMLA
jgi:thiamine pyrophosphate-dependent acetolactate synthase large subunit-like protein